MGPAGAGPGVWGWVGTGEVLRGRKGELSRTVGRWVEKYLELQV